MLENGFIIREAVSGSKNGIFLTEKAIENRQKIADAINMAISKGRQGMTDEEYENGISFLKKIFENLHTGVVKQLKSSSDSLITGFCNNER